MELCSAKYACEVAFSPLLVPETYLVVVLLGEIKGPILDRASHTSSLVNMEIFLGVCRTLDFDIEQFTML
jgi:hypothetical protein